MRKGLSIILLILLTSLLKGQSVGDLVITEIMPAPAATNAEEYFEIYNHTGSAIDIDGFIIEDAASNTHTINNGGALNIPSDGFLVLGATSDPLGDGSLVPDYVYGTGVGFNNTGDDVYLKNGATTIAQISYSSSSSGTALELKYVALGIDGVEVNDDLIDATASIGNGDLGSPGSSGNTNTDPDVNLSPAAGDLIITEFMPNPNDVGDTDGEYIEIYNATSNTIALDGCEIDGSVVANLTTIASGQFFVFGRNEDSNTNGGVPVDFQASFSLSNSSSDAIVLTSSNAIEIDRVDYTASFPFGTGVSAVFTGSAVDDNNNIANWAASSARENYSNPVGGESDLGSPGIKGSDAALPVELILFTVESYSSNVKLTWQTATEVNNYGFNVECRIENGEPALSGAEEWTTKTFVPGNGTKNTPTSYSYTDTDLPNAGAVSYRLKQIDNDGSYSYSKIVKVDLSNITDVDDEVDYTFELNQNYPNPFNPTTAITFSLPDAGSQNIAKLSVFNLLGQKVRTLVNEAKPAGQYEVQFDASKLPSGIYFYTLSYGSFTQTRKLVLMK